MWCGVHCMCVTGVYVFGVYGMYVRGAVCMSVAWGWRGSVLWDVLGCVWDVCDRFVAVCVSLCVYWCVCSACVV